MYIVSDLIKKNFELAQSGELVRYPLLESNQRASDSIRRAIDNHRISVVQGPPGTGKTSTYSDVIQRRVDSLGSNEIFLYVAPTNELVYDMLDKVSQYYALKGDLDSFKREVRVYGSQFDFANYEEINRQLSSGVKVIISTNYQRVYSRDLELDFHLLIDEASKSPLHTPFQTLVNTISENDDLRGSISIVGDPMQAISLSDAYRGNKKRILMMPYFLRGKLDIPSTDGVKDDEVLERARKEIKDGSYNFLDTTLRLPGPSHRGISSGYYDSALSARFGFSSRYGRTYMDENILRNLKNESVAFERICEVIGNARDSDVGMLLIQDETQKPYANSKDGVLYDNNRGDAGIVAAIILAATTKLKTTVVTTYVDQYLQMMIRFKRNYGKYIEKYLNKDIGAIKFKTAQSMLGAESQNVVVVLGRETSSPRIDQRTIYFQEPELLNVQLSRHKGFLVVVGNLKRMNHTALKLDMTYQTKDFRPLSETARVILQQAGYEKRSRNFVRTSSPDECYYMEIGA